MSSVGRTHVAAGSHPRSTAKTRIIISDVMNTGTDWQNPSTPFATPPGALPSKRAETTPNASPVSNANSTPTTISSNEIGTRGQIRSQTGSPLRVE